jgi:D-lyxose ketol-isomerase
MPEDWAAKGRECDEIRDNMLGWDVTDYGLGRFPEVGLVLFTIRNGSQRHPERYPKPYAEKILYVREGQYGPNHFHWHKTEDIINRGGGNVLIRLFNSTPEGEVDRETPVEVSTDGRRRLLPAGSAVRLAPGDSVTLTPGLYHDFTVEPGTGPVLLGEVSMCNDDETDNRFEPPMGRFPDIEEDEAPYRLLCSEYPAARD